MTSEEGVAPSSGSVACGNAGFLICSPYDSPLFPPAKAGQAQADQTGAQEENAAGDGDVVTRRR